MRSKTSYFNPTLFRKNLTRFWPIWAVYTVIWTMLLPVPIFIDHMENVRRGIFYRDYLQRIADNFILTYTSDSGVILALIFGLLSAIAVFSYLYNSRSAGLMHTLPIRREGLFLTNWLSGYCFMLLPHLVVALLTILTEAAAGVLNLWNVFMWLLIQSGTCFFFYAFAVFCAMFTGHILALPAFYLILNFLVMGITNLFDALISMFTFGYVGGGVFLSDLAMWFTPASKLMNGLRFRTVVENGVEVELFTGFQYVLAYVLAAVVLLGWALLLYRRRHIETAGDVIAVWWAKPLFKYGFAFCAALCGGMLLFYVFSSLFDSVVLPLTAMMVLCGILGCFVAEMLIQKSFKVFRRGWKACGIFSLIVILMMSGLSRDLFGVETWVPDQNTVASVTFYLNNSFPPYDSAAYRATDISDPDTVSRLISLHRSIVENREDLQNGYPGTSGTQEWSSLRIFYTLKNGSQSSRYYNIPIRPDMASTPGTLEESLLNMVNDTQLLLQSYFPYDAYGGRAVEGSISVYNTQLQAYQSLAFTDSDAQAVADAVRADVEAGRLGIHYLSDSDPQRAANCSFTDLELLWLYTYPNGTTHTASSTITPQFTATQTLAVLRELGILSDTQILLSHTQAQAIAAGDTLASGPTDLPAIEVVPEADSTAVPVN